jgi:hypothetical protein
MRHFKGLPNSRQSADGVSRAQIADHGIDSQRRHGGVK